MIAFYYLLRIGKYTTKGTRNNSKQTQEFKMGDITFFWKDKQGNHCCLPRDALADLIKTADGATMKLDNQKNGRKGVCVYQEANGDPVNCPVREADNTSIFKNMAAQRKSSSLYTIQGAKGVMSPPTISVQC
jgi:hypothetical protein